MSFNDLKMVVEQHGQGKAKRVRESGSGLHSPSRCRSPISACQRRDVCCLFPTVFAFLFTIISLGCGTVVDPFVETDAYFSLYGYLDVDEDTQFVRVIAHRDSIVPSAGPIDAILTSTDRETGEVTIWQDTVLSLSSNQDETGHVFWTTRSPEIGHTYDIAVQRSDNMTSRAAVTVPNPPPDPSSDVPTQIENIIRRRLVWPEAFPVAEVSMVYHVQDTTSFFVKRRVVVPYTDDFVANENTSEVVIDLTDDYLDVYNAFAFVSGTGPGRIKLLGLEIQITRASDNWTFIRSDLDYETLAFPGRFSTVANGYGFIGALVRSSYHWTITPEEVAILGYTDGQ